MQLKMKFLGYKVESIRPLNDARAVEMGANFLGEAIIFGVAGSLIILENARTRMNARDRKNHVDDTLDNLILMTSELREEIKEISMSSEHKIDELQKENQVLKKTLNEILDVSLRLRNHTPYSGQEIGIGDATGGFVLQIADEPLVRTFPSDPLPSTSSPSPSASSSSSSSSSTVVTSSDSRQKESDSYQDPSSGSSPSNKPSLQSSYDFHHEHHQLGHPQPEDDFILIDQPTSLPSQHVKKSRWGGVSVPWFSSGSSGSSGSSPSSSAA
ncbi:Optic atrophy 3 protein [Dissophora ornata]|nr:Optic atrophy 3 protein [Dissophora ornata]